MCDGMLLVASCCFIGTCADIILAFLGGRPDGEPLRERVLHEADVVMRKQARGHDGKVGIAVRTAIRRIFVDNPTLHIEDCLGANGCIAFSVAATSLGFTDQNFDAVCKVLSNSFYTDFFAELILRLNVREFLNHIAEDDGYELKVGLAKHEHFGVTLHEGRIFFTFHMSKLFQVANEAITEALACPSQKRS